MDIQPPAAKNKVLILFKKKKKKTVFIAENGSHPVGGAFNNIHGHVLKPCAQDNSVFRLLGDWSSESKQT